MIQELMQQNQIIQELMQKKVNNGKLMVETYYTFGFDEINLEIGEKKKFIKKKKKKGTETPLNFDETKHQQQLLWSNNKNSKVLKL